MEGRELAAKGKMPWLIQEVYLVLHRKSLDKSWKEGQGVAEGKRKS